MGTIIFQGRNYSKFSFFDRRRKTVKMKISLEEAQSLLIGAAYPVKENSVTLLESVGRILSRDILAPQDLPVFDKSPLDGYALKAEDTKNATVSDPAVLDVIEEIRAGYRAQKSIDTRTAIKLMTGAPVPDGADVVIKYEDVERTGNQVKIFSPLEAGKNIVRAGEDLSGGEVAATRGSMVNPPLIGLLAALGIIEVPVFNKVKIAIVSTGDELLDPSQELRPGKIYNSNLHSLAAAGFELGTQPVIMGIVPDQKDATVAIINDGLKKADIVITTGGVSVGDYDLVPDALGQVGAETIFKGVSIKPGSPVMAARKNKKLIICLSGNPAAALVSFELIAVPAIKKMMGMNRCLPVMTRVILAEDFNKESPQRRFLRGRLYLDKEKPYVRLTGAQSNGILTSMVQCNVLVDIPAGSGRLSAGQEVSALVTGRIN